MSCHFFHCEWALKCYARKMETVHLMSDHVGEEYLNILRSELSLVDKKGRYWVRQQSKLFTMCVLKADNCPVPDPTLS